MDEQLIDETLDKKLSEAYSKILDKHDIDSGDVRPEQSKRFDKVESKLKKTVKSWIEAKK